VFIFIAGWNGNKDDVKAFVNDLIKDDDGLVILVKGFLGRSVRQSLGDYVGSVEWRMDIGFK